MEGDVIEGDDDVIEVKGYAWSGGGRDIIRVEVSTDGGESWQVRFFFSFCDNFYFSATMLFIDFSFKIKICKKSKCLKVRK